MSDVVIRVEGLSKAYQIRHEVAPRHDRFSEMISDRARRLFFRGKASNPTEETFWALRDVAFDICEGEVVGIIGRNGAGKSTLLKILSRITEPTKGRIAIRGRVASLLEVGTGFHPELTGRENIFLNGAILGMSNAEIRKKFDEIVNFSGVEIFLDTPVKRYSSGMSVRLAFAVAAHLEPEIMVVDEVLAVGDAEFQRKCLGKMGEVAGSGRTIIFVSHNLHAVSELCQRVAVLCNGQIDCFTETDRAIEKYALKDEYNLSTNLLNLPRRGGDGENRIAQFEVVGECRTGRPATFRISLTHPLSSSHFRISLLLSDMYFKETLIASTELGAQPLQRAKATQRFDCKFERFPLSTGTYSVTLFLESEGTVKDWVERCAKIEVADGLYYLSGKNLPSGWNKQIVITDYKWEPRIDSEIENEKLSIS